MYYYAKKLVFKVSSVIYIKAESHLYVLKRLFPFAYYFPNENMTVYWLNPLRTDTREARTLLHVQRREVNNFLFIMII